jgi:RsiW-degrading membrane proteinase PrsW (M82 family)
MKFCQHCGTQLNDTDRFCYKCGGSCGAPVGQQNAQPTNEQSTQTTITIDISGEKIMDSLTRKINNLAGGEGAVRVPLSTVFSSIFKKHTREEAEEIFICGTAKTTPVLTDADSAWPKPWLFSRLIVAFGLAFLMMHLCCKEFENFNTYPALIMAGSFMVPLAVVVFFFELNATKNISFFTIIKVFLVGGCASFLATLLLFEIVEVKELDWGGAILVGIVEEIGKLAIVAWFIWRDKGICHPVNGLLIGATVGAGFAAIESAGYAFRFFLGTYSYSEMMDVIILRAALAPGGHVIWAAMSGYAVMISKGAAPLNTNFLSKTSFWKLFLVPVVLHSIWDMPIKFGADIYLVQILLTLIGWVVIMVLINNSLAYIGQYVQMNRQKVNAEEAQAQEILETQEA